MENNIAALKAKCEMYERMLALQEGQISYLQQELKTLHESFSLRQSSTTQQAKINVIIKLPFFQTVQKNISDIDDSKLMKLMSNSYPATQETLEILQECVNGKHTTDTLYSVSSNNFVSYLSDNMTAKKEDYTFLLDKVFKMLFEKCKTACTSLHENITSEAMNTLSDNCHDNMMMLSSSNTYKSKLQKDLLRLMKNNAFSNK